MMTFPPPDESDLTPETPNADPIAQENALRADALAATASQDAYAALRIPNFRRFLVGQSIAVLGGQMMSVTVGWELYRRTDSTLALGLVGLVQIIPILALFLPAGQLIDRVNRRNLVLLCQGIQGITVLFLGLASLNSAGIPAWGVLDWTNARLDWFARTLGETSCRFNDRTVPLMFALLFVQGATRAFAQPARSSLMPHLVPQNVFTNAVTWNTSSFETFSITGPLLAGGVISLWEQFSPGSPWTFASIYFFTSASAALQILFFAGIRLQYVARPREPITLRTLLAGVSWLYGNKIIYAAVVLDMFAVLLGGATSLLPVFARDILHVGPIGFAALRAAPSIGAISMAIYSAHAPPYRHAGRVLLLSVAGFGAATIVFGLSKNFALSLTALFFTGAFDNISVVIRHSFVQLLTPDEMRGRVSAANSVFIASSNELGTFESGATTALGVGLFSTVAAGAMFSVVSGGAGAILVAAIIGMMYPQLHRVGRLDKLGSKL